MDTGWTAWPGGSFNVCTEPSRAFPFMENCVRTAHPVCDHSPCAQKAKFFLNKWHFSLVLYKEHLFFRVQDLSSVCSYSPRLSPLRGLWHLKQKRKPYICGSCSLVAQLVKNLPAMLETQVWSMGQGDPLETGMITHSSILARWIPWRGAWRATVHGVTKSWTQVSD